MIAQSASAQIRAAVRALGFIKPFWHTYILVFFFGTIAATMSSIPVMLISKMSRFLPPDDRTIGATALFVFGPLLGVVFMNVVVLASLNNYISWYLGLRLSLGLRIRFFQHLQRLPVSFHQGRPVGELIYRSNADIDASIPVVLSRFPGLFNSIYASSLYFALVLTTGSPLLIYYLVCFVPFYFAAHLMYTVIRRFDYKYRVQSQRLTATLRESVAGARVVKAFNKVRFEVLKYYHRMSEFYRANQKRFLLNLFAMNVQQAALRFGMPFLYPIMAVFVLLGTIEPIQYFGLITMCLLLVYHVEILYQNIQNLRVSLIPVQRLLEVLDIEPSVQEKKDAIALRKLQGSLEFENVTFSYVPGVPVLSDISLRLEPGQKLGVVGPSGAGKSTLAQLILRSWDPDSGAVRIDGHDLRNLTINSVLKQMGVVLQSTDLFGGTIADNIRYGKPNATDAEVEEAAKAAGLHGDVLTLPMQYETQVGEGEKLSGGQRQRVALARALIKKPRLLLLDEPTASLDPRTAAHIGETLREISSRTTTLLISHRIGDVEDADLILVMKDGRIVERGKYGELMARNGLFAMLARQAELEDIGEEDGTVA